MTTIDITATPVFAAPAVSTRLRLTVRGRRVLALLASAPVVAALAIAIVSGGGALASVDTGAPAGTFEQVTVMPGQSLWSIAEELAPGSDPRDVVDAIVRLNALPSGALVVGQNLAVPLEYSARY